MKNTLILIALSVLTLVLGAALNLTPGAFAPGIIGITIGVTLLKAGKRA